MSSSINLNPSSNHISHRLNSHIKFNIEAKAWIHDILIRIPLTSVSRPSTLANVDSLTPHGNVHQATSQSTAGKRTVYCMATCSFGDSRSAWLQNMSKHQSHKSFAMPQTCLMPRAHATHLAFQGTVIATRFSFIRPMRRA